MSSPQVVRKKRNRVESLDEGMLVSSPKGVVVRTERNRSTDNHYMMRI